jgi:hypothetical protein
MEKTLLFRDAVGRDLVAEMLYMKKSADLEQ